MSAWLGQDYGKAQARSLDRDWSGAMVNAQNLYRGALRNQQFALDEIPKPYAQARRALRMQGDVAARGINEQATQRLAGTQQDAISRGLFNTTGFDAANRTIRTARARSLDELDAHIIEEAAQLELDEGQAVAGQKTAIAGTKLNFAQAQGALASKQSNQYAQIYYGKQGGLIQPVATLAGLAIGGYAGGAFGKKKYSTSKASIDSTLDTI
jgi:hypothetical protein